MSAAIREARQQAAEKLAALGAIAEERKLTDDENTEVDALKAEILDLNKRLDTISDAEAAVAATGADDEKRELRAAARPAGGGDAAAPRIEQEHRDPGHYRGTADSAGWLSDQYRAAALNDTEARRRLEEENRYGLQWRKAHASEMRDLTHATDTDGGSLTPVKYLQEFHAQLRRAGGATLNICRKLPLPTGTDQVSIPVMSSGVSTSIATENNAVSETDIVWGTNVTADVVYRSSLQDISLQLLQQSNPAVEQVVMTDIMKALVTAADSDILSGTTPEGIFNADNTNTTTYTAGTATFAGLYSAIVQGINEIWTSFYGSPSHIIMHPRRWAWCLAQVDGSNRPQLGFNPMNSAGGFDPALAAEGVVGNILGVPVVIDANVRTTQGSGTDEDEIAIVVGDELFLWMREPVLELDMSAGFKSLQATVRGYLPYAFTAERYPGSISLLSGTGLNDTL